MGSQRAARRQHAFVETLSARPGDIFDREGRLLATSKRSDSLAIDPAAIEEPERFARQLAGVLGIDADALADMLGAISAAAEWLSKGDDTRFMNDVALRLQD